jgi:hypothetical protein
MSAYADHEARLRAVLHAAADSLEPHGDGLERIRGRLRHPQARSLAWMRAVSAELAMRAPAWLQDAIYHVADWVRLVAERFAPAQQTGRHRSRAHGLLRPLAAMAVVMFIVAAGTYVAIDASTAIFPSSSNGQPGGAPRAGGGSGTPGSAASHSSGPQAENGPGRSSPAPAPSCTTPLPAQSTTSAPPPQSANPSANLDPTPTDSTSTDTSAPSPTDSSTTSDASASVAPSPQPTGNALPTTGTATTPTLTKPPSGC